jgi:hypothetical protein
MSEKWVSMRLAPVPCVCTNHNNIEFAATQNNAIATFTLPFLLLLLSLKRLVYSREKEEKMKGFCLLSNGQHPTNQTRGEGTEQVKALCPTEADSIASLTLL